MDIPPSYVRLEIHLPVSILPIFECRAPGGARHMLWADPGRLKAPGGQLEARYAC